MPDLSPPTLEELKQAEAHAQNDIQVRSVIKRLLACYERGDALIPRADREQALAHAVDEGTRADPTARRLLQLDPPTDDH